MRLLRVRAALLILIIATLLSSAHARVARVEVFSRADIQEGKPFGAVGPYERVTGRVTFALKPGDPHNTQIVDLDKADRNPDGEVEFTSIFEILKPKDVTKSNGAVLFEVSNRGGKGIVFLVNGTEGEFGDGFLMRQGFTVAWLGWEHDIEDLPGRLRLNAPVAHLLAGKEIRGLVRGDFTPAEKKTDWPLGHILLGLNGGVSYPVDKVSDPQNTLTVRDTPAGKRQLIPRDKWFFGRETQGREIQGKLVPDPRNIHMNDGFQPGKIYEVVYSSKNPVVVGTGLAAVRDFLSYLKYDPQAVAPVKRAYAAGISQSGRFLRHYLYQDFNADEQGRQVMDGVLAHVAGAGRGSFNHRFAQPSRDSQPMSSIFYPTDLFPFTDLPQKDPVTGETAGLLDAPVKSKTAPKIFFSNTSYEYWGRSAALIHVTPDGASDASIGANVRVYFFAGLQHYSRGFPPAKTMPGNLDVTAQQAHNPNPIQWYWRAMITNMDRWVKDGAEPPASVYPKLADGTLVPFTKWAFPKIPGVTVPTEENLAYRLSFGLQWKQGIISTEPPHMDAPFPGFVPQPDATGNDTGGVRLPELDVPLATYTGWNLRDKSIGAPEQRLSFVGSFIPLTRTAQERQQVGDPRPSIGERYSSRDDYKARFEQAAKKLIEQRFILQEDLPAVMARGQKEWDVIVEGK
jgi:hypothetical protein